MTTTINSNGSKWAGQPPDTIEELIEVLAHEPLNSDFEKYGNFVIQHNDGSVRFFGNFLAVSHVFNIDSDNPEIIERLTKAIRANQQTALYRDGPSMSIAALDEAREAKP